MDGISTSTQTNAPLSEIPIPVSCTENTACVDVNPTRTVIVPVNVSRTCYGVSIGDSFKQGRHVDVHLNALPMRLKTIFSQKLQRSRTVNVNLQKLCQCGRGKDVLWINIAQWLCHTFIADDLVLRERARRKNRSAPCLHYKT